MSCRGSGAGRSTSTGSQEDAWGEALFLFEAALVSLNGALDAASASAIPPFVSPARWGRASWLRPRWRDALVAAAPELDDPLDPASGPLVARRTRVSVLRNYIHSEALTEELHSGDPEGPTTMDSRRLSSIDSKDGLADCSLIDYTGTDRRHVPTERTSALLIATGY
jgi:hypothetical protein